MTVKIKSGGKEKELVGDNMEKHLDHLRKEMIKAAENLEFEQAAQIRDEVRRLEAVELTVAGDPMARQNAIRLAEEEAAWQSGRSTAGKGGTRSYKGKSKKKMK